MFILFHIFHSDSISLRLHPVSLIEISKLCSRLIKPFVRKCRKVFMSVINMLVSTAHRESILTLGRAWKFPWAMEFSMGDGNFHGRCFFCGHGNFQGLEISMAMYYWIDAIALNLVFDGMFLSSTWNHLLV